MTPTIQITCTSGNAYRFPVGKLNESLPHELLRLPEPACVDPVDLLEVRAATAAACFVTRIEALPNHPYVARFLTPDQTALLDEALGYVRPDTTVESFATTLAAHLHNMTYFPQTVSAPDVLADEEMHKAMADCWLSTGGFWGAIYAAEYAHLKARGHTPDEIAKAVSIALAALVTRH